MYIKISKKSQLVLLRNINPFLGKYKIPKKVLHKLGTIMEQEFTDRHDYIALFLEPVKNDYTDILDALQIYPMNAVLSEDNFSDIKISNKKKRMWCWCDIHIKGESQKMFAVYSIKMKDLDRRGGF